MVSRIDASSVSVAPNIPLSLFASPPTQEGIIGVDSYEEILSENAVDSTQDGDTVVLRMNPTSAGQGYDLSNSFVKCEFRILKKAKASMREDFLQLENITTAEGFPSVGLFSRESMSFNQTPVNLELASGSLDQAQYVNAMLTRPKRSLAAEADCGGFYRDSLNEGPGAHMRFTIDTSGAAGSGMVTVAATGVIQLNPTNAELRAAKIRPSSLAANGGVPAVLGDLRAGMRCRLEALAGVAGNVTDFNAKIGSLDLFVQSHAFNVFPASQFIQPGGDTDADRCNLVFQFSGDHGGALLSNGPGGGGAAPAFFTVDGTPAITARNITKVQVTLFPDDRTYASMRQRRAQDLPLGMNLGAMQRRARFLAGSALSGAAFNTDDPDQAYPTFSYAYQPMMAAWKDTPYLPPGVLVELKLQRNNFNRCLVDFSPDRSASDNLKLKLTKVSIMAKRVTYSPQIDAALATTYQSGSLLKLPGLMHRLYSQRIEAGSQNVIVRNFSQGTMARTYVIYATPDDVSTVGSGQLPAGGKSVFDLGFESGVYPTVLYGIINGQTYPLRRLEAKDDQAVVDMMVTRAGTGTANNVLALNGHPTYGRYSGDTAVAWELYRAATADSTDPALDCKQWTDRPIYVLDTSLGPANTVDPVVENTSAEIHLQLNKQVTQAYQINVLSYTESMIEISGSGQVSHSDA